MLSFQTRNKVFLATSADSQTLFLTLISTTAMTAPLFIDMALDAFGMMGVPYLGQRFMSTLVLALGNGTILLYFESPSMSLVLISCFVWSYYLDFSISISSLHTLSELPQSRSLTVGRVLAHLTLFVFFAFALLSETKEVGGRVSEVLAIIGLTAFTALVLAKAYLVLKAHYSAFIRSEMSALEWYKQNARCFFVQIRVIGLVVQLVVLFIILSVFGTRLRGSYGVLPSGNLATLLVVRSVFFLFDYFLSSRIFRSQMIQTQHECSLKTKLIKYFSHEMRSPIMCISVGLELLDKKLRLLLGQVSTEVNLKIDEILADSHRCCFLALEVLDSLLLYGSIASGDLNLKLQQFKPLQGLRQMLKQYKFIAQGLNVGVFICHNAIETHGLKGRIDLDLASLKNVFGPLIWSMAKKVEDTATELTFNDFPELVTECLVEGSLSNIPSTNDFCLNITIGDETGVCESAIRARMKRRIAQNAGTMPRVPLLAALWLHIEIIDVHGNIKDADIDMMKESSPDFSRKGYCCCFAKK